MFAPIRTFTRLVPAAALVLALAGCGKTPPLPPTAPGAPAPAPAPPGPSAPVDEVTAERAKLSPEDRALVDAQEWCVISQDERLGSMGPPIKLTINGQPVFICCKGCKRKAEAEADKTLATVAELKAKAKAERAKAGTP